MTLLAAFKFWLSHDGKAAHVHKPRPQKVLINNKMHDLVDIEVIDNTLLIGGRILTKDDVLLAGLVYSIEGNLYLDLTGEGYSTIEAKPDKITISKT